MPIIFSDMVNKGVVKFDMTTPKGQLEFGQIISQPHLQASKIIATLFDPKIPLPVKTHTFHYDSGNVLDLSYGDRNETLTVRFTAEYSAINSVISHTEPKDATKQAICANKTLYQAPLDGIRFVEFDRANQHFSFQYPDFFRIAGTTQTEVAANLFKMVQEKDIELNAKLGRDANLIAQFVAQNANLLEPILWRQMGLDQKHEAIAEKYLNRDSFLPVPASATPLNPPLAKPKGYEVLHVVAKGDSRGFQFALNSSHLPQAPKSGGSAGAAATPPPAPATPPGSGASSGQGTQPETLYSCGGPDGVEIWEWFNGVQCWIEKEISKLPELISLENTCTEGARAEPDNAEENVLDEKDNTELSVVNPATVPDKIEVAIDSKTLVQGQKEPVRIKVLNKAGKPIVDYLSPLSFSLEDPSLGRFDQPEKPVFTGTEKSNLVIGLKTGGTQLRVKLGNDKSSFSPLSSTPIPVRMIESAKIQLSANRKPEGNQVAYEVTATVVDPLGQRIMDVNSEALLGLVRPSDGVLVNGGRFKIESGQGKTLFFPNPMSPRIDVVSIHPFYKNETLAIVQPENAPFRVMIDAPKYWSIAQTQTVPIRVADANGLRSKSFNGEVAVKITDTTKEFATLVSDKVLLSGGVGQVSVKILGETGVLGLVASFPGLVPAEARIPLVARIDDAELAKTFPQTLFASFVGFPAGNVAEENYYGGVQLFGGKTEAVFSFMETPSAPAVVTVKPNYKILTTQPRHAVLVFPLEKAISFQVSDQKNLKPLLSIQAPMDFDRVALWDEGQPPALGTAYVEVTDKNYKAVAESASIVISDKNGDKVLTLAKDGLKFSQNDYELSYDKNSDADFPDLILAPRAGLANAKAKVGRIKLDFKPRDIRLNLKPLANDSDPFELYLADPSLATRKEVSGKSTADPAGLVLFDPAQAPEGMAEPENFGYEGDNKYLLRFGGGSPIGEAVMFNLPVSGVLLGDPTVTLKNSSASSLNYDNTIGRQIYQDAEASDIVSVTNFDFNADGIQDVAAVMKDGRIRLFEGGPTDPPFRDRGNIAFVADGVLSINAFDFRNDGYEDLVISTREGRLAVLDNDAERITRTDQKVKVGKQIYQLFKQDMDADGYADLVTFDSRGDIRIFYNQSRTLLSQGKKPPFTAKDQLPENGVFVGNYGFSLKLGQNIKGGLRLRYPGMPEPAETIAPSPIPSPTATIAETGGDGLPHVTPPPAVDFGALEGFADKDTSGEVSEEEAKAHVKALDDATQLAAAGGQAPEVPTLPWAEGEKKETYFAPLSDYEKAGKSPLFTVEKNVVNRDRPGAADLDLGETLKYTLKVQSDRNLSGLVLADLVPDSLEFDPKSVKCDSGPCEGMKVEFKEIYLFISSLTLTVGKPIAISYEATVKHTPKSSIYLNRIKDPTLLEYGGPGSVNVSKAVTNLNTPLPTVIPNFTWPYKPFVIEGPPLRLKYTLTLQTSQNLVGVRLADAVPSAISADWNTLRCAGGGCGQMSLETKGSEVFFRNLNPNAATPTVITYEALVVKKTNEPRYFKNPAEFNSQVDLKVLFQAPLDPYMDIMVSPPGNKSGQLIVHYTTASRIYRAAATKKERAETETVFTDYQNALSGFADIDQDDPKAIDKIRALMDTLGLSKVDNDMKTCELDATGKKTTPSPEACAADPSACATESMNNVADDISSLSCTGGGCFPMPYNMSFMAPGAIPFAMPLISFPATMVTPPAPPYPFPSFFAMAPSPMGATTVKGVYNSMLRFYMIPTLTGGVDLALCWSLYMGDSPSPPPMMPIPYPPPIGNCMSFALPMGALPPCKLIAMAMGKLMEMGNSVISDANSGIAAVNSGSGLPTDLANDQGQGGGGGMEIGLAADLGGKSKFEPPPKGFTNTHVGSFDSIGGVIGSWLDRQLLEILNKLLTMPTISVITPDFNSLIFDDIEQLKKQWGALNVKAPVTKGGEQTADVEAFLSGLNSQWEQLYTILGSLPMVTVNEKNIDFKIPWVSYAEFKDYIRQLEQAIDFYKKKILEYKDVLAQYQCPDPDQPTSDCVAAKALGLFVTNLDDFVNSLQKNLLVIQSYMNFPRDFVLFERQLADYVRQFACMVDTLSQTFGGWTTKIQNQIIGYMEAVATIMAIVKDIKKMLDIFSNFENSCDTCTNERFGNFGWFTLLGMVIPDVPIIKMPAWPDIVLDLSDLDVNFNIEMPKVNFVLEPIQLPKIPLVDLPELPGLSDLQLLLSIPPMPVLPSLPKLPELPALPSIPTLNLPTLPPPPKLPDIGGKLQVPMDLVNMILKIWCMIKKSYTPVPESYLKDHAVLNTNRPSYLTPLDLLKPKIGDIGGLDTGFNEIRIEVTTYLGIRFKLALEKVAEAAGTWNGWVTNLSDAISGGWQESASRLSEEMNKVTQYAQQGIDYAVSKGEFGLQGFQNWIDKEVTGKLATLSDAGDQAIRDFESSLQSQLDEATDKTLGEGMRTVNKTYSNAIVSARQAMATAGMEWSAETGAFFRSNIGQWATNPFHALQLLAKWAEDNKVNFGGLQDKINEASAQLDDLEAQGVLKVEEGAKAVGTAVDSATKPLQDSASKAGDAVGQGAKAVGKAVETGQGAYEGSSVQDRIQDPLNTDGPQSALPPTGEQSDMKNSLLAKFQDLAKSIDAINSDSVDYRVLKKGYNVPDAHLAPLPTVRKMQEKRKELLAFSDRLEKEADEVSKVPDLIAWLQSGKSDFATVSDGGLPQQLASANAKADGEVLGKVESVEAEMAQSGPLNPPLAAPKGLLDPSQKDSGKASAGGCPGTCLVDPATGLSVQFIPHFDNPSMIQTAFIPTRIKGYSDVVYGDGPALYFKRNLAVPENISQNSAPSVPNTLFSLDRFITRGKAVQPLKGSVNMMATVLTENSAATINWMPSTNPDLYGYGIQLERSVLGYDNDHEKNGLPDLTILLLPPAGELSPPVFADGKPVSYGTLVTSYEDKKDARARFGIEPKAYLTGAKKVVFPTIGNAGINLGPNKAVLFEAYSGDTYRLLMDNGFYHIKMAWFDKSGRVSNYNRNEVLSPQSFVSAPAPIALPKKDFRIPVYTKGVVNANEIFMDPAGSYQYYWDVNQDGLIDNYKVPTLEMPPESEPRTFEMDVTASQDIADEAFPRFKKTVKVVVYVPEIKLEAAPLKEQATSLASDTWQATLQGTMKPTAADHDLTNMPFSVFRKRWETWKNLGVLKKGQSPATKPPLQDKVVYQAGKAKIEYKDNYFAINGAGDYTISGFTAGPSSVLVKDLNAKSQTLVDVARVRLGTGQVEILEPDYTFQAVPASRKMPTRVVIFKKNFTEVMSNVYFVADGNTDVTILNEPLSSKNVSSIGVTVGDESGTDTVIARNLPGYAESYPGGVAIFDEKTQLNVALVSTSGAIRMMQTGYKLRVKNAGKLDEPVIFQIVDSANRPVYDVFIAANFNKLEIRQEEVWGEMKATLGFLKKAAEPWFASLMTPVLAAEDPAGPVSGKPAPVVPETTRPAIPHPAAVSPFVDVKPEDPYYKAILDLYQRRIITGYKDATFKPDAKISRAEFVKIALGATNCVDCSKPNEVQKQKYSSRLPFPDVLLSAWYYFCISIGKELGMVTGYGDGFFRPERNISRAEAAAVLIRQSAIKLQTLPENTLIDVPADAWYKDYVYTAIQIGLISNRNGFVLPNEEISRGEFAFMASSVLAVQDCRLVDSDKDGMPDWWEMSNGLDPLDPLDALLNADGDAFDNLTEYKNGTDPNKFDAMVSLCPCIDNPNQNDTDRDGIIDACDDDLDSDSVKNALCFFDAEGLIDPTLAKASQDNCVFMPNADQKDSNGDGVGDLCLQIDLCDGIPEDYDGINDTDGCPEVTDDTAPNPPGAYVNKGPLCYFLDYEADMVKGDVFMTAITDVKTHTTIYKSSNEVTY